MRRPNYFKIGLFVLGAAAVLVMAVIAFGVGALFEEQVRVETYFVTSVQGLDIGSPVKYRGVQIGKVEELEVVRKEYRTHYNYVLVRMVLDSDTFLPPGEKITPGVIAREVAQGLRVRLGFQGVTGAAYIEADYVDPSINVPLKIDWSPKYPYIPTAPSIITRITDAIDGILRNLEKINVEGITGNLEKTLGALSRTLDQANARQIGEEAAALLRELRETNRRLDAKLQGMRIEPVLEEAGDTLAQIRRLAGETEEPLREFLHSSAQASARLERVLAGLESSDDLPQGLAHFRQVLSRLDRLLSTQQDEVETTLENLREMSENFRALSEEARENPSGLLFTAPPPRRTPGDER